MQLPVAGRIDAWLDGEPAKGGTRGMQTPWGTVVHESPAPPRPQLSCVIESTKFQLDTPVEYLQRYSEMVRANRKEELTNAINLMLPRIKDLEILTDDRSGESYLSAMTTDGVQLPLHDLGGGVVRLYRLLLNFFTCRDGILLADEMESGIHHSVLREVWVRARQWMREWNVQLVATSHSAECIESAIAAFLDAPEDLSIHKLFMSEQTGRVEAATFTGETLEGARDLDLELR